VSDSVSQGSKAGRGGLYVLGAKVCFIGMGLVQQSVLPHLIGLAAYGSFARVMAISNVVNNVVVAASLQGMSRAVLRLGVDPWRAFRGRLLGHGLLGLGIASALVAAAAPLAKFQHAEHVALPLAIAAAVTLLYAVYAPIVGAFNGTQRFRAQAAFDASSAVLRTGLVLGGGALGASLLGSGTLGAVIGTVVSAIVMLGAAGIAARSLRPALGTAPPTARYAQGIVTLAAAQLFTNLLMQADLTLLGRALGSVPAVAAREGAQAAATPLPSSHLADEWVGVYRACQLFAFLPYQLIASVSQVLFPLVAAAQSEGDRERVRHLVRSGGRWGTLACCGFVAVIVGNAGGLLRLAFGSDVSDRGTSTLLVLGAAHGFFALYALTATVLASLGRERVSLSLTALAVVVLGTVFYGLLPRVAFGEAQLRAAASMTAVVMASLWMASASRVWHASGAFTPGASLVRAFLACGLASWAGTQLPGGPVALVPVKAALTFAIYGAALFALRELAPSDLAAVRAVWARRRPS
jgi:stage V sporulation protein B